MSRVRLLAITKHYGATIAVHEFSLDVADGEFVTLLGPSGCGKTTTLRMIAGLIEPSSGHIYFDEQEVTLLAPPARNIGFVFQTPALFPHLSVADNIAFGLSVKGRKKEAIQRRVAEMLALVELEGYGQRLPAQLSGGQQQRVALARVLATDPRVLLFDEPLSALDKNLRDTLKYSILDLQRKTHKTAIYVTHDQSEAFAISDRIVVMHRGRVEQIGRQTDIYLQPQTPFVAEFIGANNSLAGIVSHCEGAGEAARVVVMASGLTLTCKGRPAHTAPAAYETGTTGSGATGSGATGSGAPFQAGDPVLVYIRPENLIVLGNGEGAGYENVVEGVVDRVIFEGATAQLRVDVGGRELRADVSGGQRLTLLERHGRVRLGFNDVTLIPR